MSERESTEVAASLPSAELVDAPPSLAPIAVELQARTDVGREREHNEDNFIVADLSRGQRGGPESHGSSLVVGGHGLLLAVCDGMGGAAAGEVASQMAVDVIYQHVVGGLPLEGAFERDGIARSLVRAVEEAGFRIFEAARADRSRRGMGTTVTAAALVDEMLFLAQVGDSRAYLLRDDKLVQVTRDQSLVNQLIEAGQLTEDEAETFEHNNIILQALGTSDHVQVDLTYAELRAGDRLLLCSDGLSGMVRNEEIRKILVAASTPAEASQVLIDRANANGGHDNITVITAFFESGLKSPSVVDLPLAYRKYVLPEVDDTQTMAGAGLKAVAESLSLGAAADRLRQTPRMQTGVFSAIPIPAPSSEPTPREPLPRSVLAFLVASVVALVAAVIYARR